MIWFLCILFGCLPLSNLVRGSSICDSIEIRTPEEFSLLSQCTIVVGHVSIVNVQLPLDSDPWVDYSTPIEEITDYLLVHRTHGLKSLQQLFPHLVIVRGQELLFEKYALIVYENRDLRDLGLSSLLRIQHGAIRIEANPVLCFVDTVNWVQLLGNSTLQHFTFKKNQSPNYCPLCLARNEMNQSSEHCWNLHTYQRLVNAGQASPCPNSCGPAGCDTPDDCCSTSCLSGWHKTDCDLCANFRNVRTCMDTCDFPYYEFNKRECVPGDVCRKYKMVPFAGVCRKQCPAHYRVVYNAQGLPTCTLLCNGTYIINTAQDLFSLKDCSSIQGSLVIELKDFKSNIINEMERSLSNLKEITGYLKVIRSPQLVSLHFLHNLDTIGGNELIVKKYALYIVDNHHLEQIWAANQNVAVLKGRVFFHLNPRLCHDKIMMLQPSLRNVAKITIEDASPNSNGERVICGNDVRVLNATLEDFNATAVLIKVNPVSSEDLQVLIGYSHHYKEAPQRNVTMYDGRHGCGHDNWLMDVSPNPNVRHIISNLKPYTQYAYFVKTLTRSDYHMQIDAYSNIQYFRTLPSKPGPVAKIYYRTMSATEIIVHWWPPKTPNGQLEKYIISYEIAELEHQTASKATKDYPAQATPSSTDVCHCNASNPDLSGTFPDDENYYNKDMVVFDDALPNLIYVSRSSQMPIKKKKPPLNSSGLRSKRRSDDIADNKIDKFSKAETKLQHHKRETNDDHEDDYVKARRFYENYHLEMERKALQTQDTGREGFQILKPPPACTVSNPTTQHQLENRCKPIEQYKGIAVPAHQHQYTLGNLAPEQTYRISIRACVAGLANGCGPETTALAETVSKRMETFLKEFRALT